MAQQLSVFLGNQNGRLREVVKALAEKQVNILTFSLADTQDFGILRLIVDQPRLGLEALQNAGLTARMNEVMVVKISPQPGTLEALLENLGDGQNIAYIYPFATEGKDAGMVIKVGDLATAMAQLRNAGYEVF